MMILSTVTMFFLVSGIVAMGIGLGALYPNFTHQNIAQVSTGFGGVVYILLCSLFVAVVVVLEAGPVYILFTAQAKGVPVAPYQWVFIVGSFSAVLVVIALVIRKPMVKGLRAYEP